MRAAWLHLDESGITADLAQLEQRLEHDDVTARESLCGDGGTNLFVHRGAYGFIQVALRAFEFDGAHDSRFRRQFGGDLILAPSQHEGANAPREQIAPHGVAAFFDRACASAS